MSKSANILLITTDQHRRDTLGCYGASICETPNIDALASDGVTFDHAYTVTAICTPARASMLTGYAPFRHKLLANFERNVGYPTELSDDTRMIPSYLTDYRCANIGKWHIGQERGPDSFGFDGFHYEGWHQPYQHPDYLAYLKEHGLPEFSVRDQIRGIFPNGKQGIPQLGIHDAPVEATYCHYLTTRTIEKLESYVADDADTPFFLACQFYGPHLPYFLPEEVLNCYDPSLVEPHPSMAETFAGKPQVQKNYSLHWGMDTLSWETWQRLIAAYWGYVNLIDGQVGRLVAALENLNLSDDTVVIFTADHGGFVGNHRLADKGPAMYDDIYRIPFVVKHPQSKQKGVRSDAFVSLLDITPTVLDIAQVDDHADIKMDGISFLPLILSEDVPVRDWITAEFHGHHFPYPQRMIRTHQYKLVVNPADINELYDLDADSFELNNIYDHPAYKASQGKLMGQLYNHLVSSGDNFHHWLPTMFDLGSTLNTEDNQALVQ